MNKCKACGEPLPNYGDFCDLECENAYQRDPLEPGCDTTKSKTELAITAYLHDIAIDVCRKDKAIRRKNRQIARLREKMRELDRKDTLSKLELQELRNFLIDIVKGEYDVSPYLTARADQLLTRDYPTCERLDKVMEELITKSL